MITGKDISVYLIPGLAKNISVNLDYTILKLLETDLDSLNNGNRSDKKDNKKIFCYLHRKYSRKTYSQIGDLLGIDHSTVIHKIKKLKDLSKTDKWLEERIFKIEQELRIFQYEKINYGKN